MRLAGVLALLGALAGGVPAAAGELPAGVVALVDDTLPGYHLPSAEMDGSHVARADFDADGRDDVAALLAGAADWQLAIFRQREPDHYQAVVIDRFPGDDRDFRERLSIDQLALDAVPKGAALEIDGAIVEDAAVNAASLVLRLPPAEASALLFQWDPAHDLFGTTRLRLAAAPASAGKVCAYDPDSGLPNPLGMRAFVTVSEEAGNTIFVYEKFPETLAGSAPATLAIRRELVFHQTPIEQARALMLNEPGYYQDLTGDDDPAGFVPLDATLTCN